MESTSSWLQNGPYPHTTSPAKENVPPVMLKPNCLQMDKELLMTQSSTRDNLVISADTNTSINETTKPMIEVQGNTLKELDIPMRGILVNGTQAIHDRQKKDYYGVAIDKEKKLHHITFRDIQQGHPIAEVKEVESYKLWNVNAEYSIPECPCLLL